MDPRVELKKISPFEYKPHPDNWKEHPPTQKKVLREFLKEIGFITAVVVNERTKHVLDGHLRIQEAIDNGIMEIPAVVVDVPEEDEVKVLVMLDQIAKMSQTNKKKRRKILKQVGFNSRLLEDLRKKEIALYKDAEPTDFVVSNPSPRHRFIVLYFDSELNYEHAKEIFGVGKKYNSRNKKLEFDIYVDGDKWLEKRNDTGE